MGKILSGEREAKGFRWFTPIKWHFVIYHYHYEPILTCVSFISFISYQVRHSQPQSEFLPQARKSFMHICVIEFLSILHSLSHAYAFSRSQTHTHF